MENIKYIKETSPLELPDDENIVGPVVMLNMLKFKDRAYYFNTYLPAFQKVTKTLGFEEVKIVLASDVRTNVIAPADQSWDCILLVEYPSAKAFKIIAESAIYQEMANAHRLAATEVLNLYMTTPFEL